ncbi:MAG: DNA polymerase IV [Bifidobacteriaceae bacterium]|jgi:DNA polymerase-4|nr:DNA polymerase IV [Bifidobacteriaceae bacterium]
MSKTPIFTNLKHNWGNEIESLAIVHIDMDAFFAAIEEKQHPESFGLPIIVGGTNLSGTIKGVVSSANYLARKSGVHAGQPMVEAKRYCPQAKVYPVNMNLYEEVSQKALTIYNNFTPLVEAYSIDEVFLDLNGSKWLFGSVIDTVKKIRQQIANDLGLTCSAGIAPNKLIAKLAAAQAKPNGQIYVCADAVESFIQALPVGSIWGIGPATVNKLKTYGISTVKQLAQLDYTKLKSVFKEKIGLKIWQSARGIDYSKVEPYHEPKSIGNQETLYNETYDETKILEHLLKMVEKSVARLCQAEYKTRRITLYIRYSGFLDNSTSLTVPDALCDTQSIYSVAKSLYYSIYNGKKVRLIGISFSKLITNKDDLEQSKFDIFEYGVAKKQRLQTAINRLNNRYGKQVVHYM